MKIFRLVFAVGMASFCVSNSAHAFPEMVRYGYTNCNACHVSLTGGGVLNDYGREIAREKLALFKSDDEKNKEHLFAYGALADTSIAKYLKLGGDVRSVYYLINNDTVKQAQTIFMQGDLEGAFVMGKWTVDGTVGIEQPIPGQTVDFISRRHYLQYALSDNFNVRAGKYVPAFGIKNPEHPFLTRDQLQFADQFESYNLEFSYITDQWNVFLTGVFGRFDDQQADQDRGGTAQVSYAPTEKIKVGLNEWYGKQEANHQERTVTGVFGMVGVTPKLYASSEIDYQHMLNSPNGGEMDGLATTQKFSYEVLEGFWAALVQQYGKIDFMTPTTRAEDYGIELQIYPRSHFEFSLAYDRKRDASNGDDFYDYYYLVSHFYF